MTNIFQIRPQKCFMMAPSCTHCTKISIKLHMMCTNSKTPNQNVMYLTLTLTLLTHIIIKKWKRMIRFRTVGGYSFLRRGWRRRGGGGRAGGGREGGEGGGGLQRGALQLQAEVMGYCWRPRSSSDQPDVIEMDKNWNGYCQTSQPITLEAKWF